MLIMIIVLVVIGPKRLPELLRNAGKLMGQLRRASDELRNEILYSDEFRSIQDTMDETKDNFIPPAVPPRLRTKKKGEAATGKTEEAATAEGTAEPETGDEPAAAGSEQPSSHPETVPPHEGQKVEDRGGSSDEH